MVYGYIRVSTDKQTVENQRFEIENFCSNNNIAVDYWIEETVSGVQSPDKRQLGSLLALLKTGDLIICSELSRLGRDFFMLMSILYYLLINGVKIWSIKENYRLEDTLEAICRVFGYGISAKIERDMISLRTRQALLRKKSEGFVLGRPHGSKSKMLKLSGHEAEIRIMLDKKASKSAIARRFGVCRKTVISFLKNRPEAPAFKILA